MFVKNPATPENTFLIKDHDVFKTVTVPLATFFIKLAIFPQIATIMSLTNSIATFMTFLIPSKIPLNMPFIPSHAFCQSPVKTPTIKSMIPLITFTKLVIITLIILTTVFTIIHTNSIAGPNFDIMVCIIHPIIGDKKLNNFPNASIILPTNPMILPTNGLMYEFSTSDILSTTGEMYALYPSNT